MANEIASGATKGAVAGSAFGPWGAAIGGVAGAGLGALSSNSKKKARKEAEIKYYGEFACTES